jgi:hypothetical protein
MSTVRQGHAGRTLVQRIPVEAMHPLGAFVLVPDIAAAPRAGRCGWMVVAATTSIQTKKQVTEILDREFSEQAQLSQAG